MESVNINPVTLKALNLAANLTMHQLAHAAELAQLHGSKSAEVIAMIAQVIATNYQTTK